ncbi:ATP-binding protein [Rhodoligotrophos defluvii]|uniref:ATP-binding protein n=1 Tax=Rhodoligotrophos defluvii TaxID=2561934 RepID=UPI001EF127B7|nr:ATP-binding protein [Rhodoligotrophos defluvii]
MAHAERFQALPLTAKAFLGAQGPVDLKLECAFFSRLKMRNGTFKYTEPGRFAALEPWLAPIFKQRLKQGCAVLDVGASTGLTTIELVDFLAAEGLGPGRVVATDRFIEAHLVELTPWLSVLSDPEGWPLQYDVGGIGIRAWSRRLDLVTLAALPRFFARMALQPRLRARIVQGQSQPFRMESRALAGRAIELVDSDVLLCEPGFVGQFDFIRAANLLNAGYFTTGQLGRAVDNLRRYCRAAGALLLVVRTVETGHDGTLFELDEHGRFRVTARVGRGAEVEALVLAADPSRPGADP